MDFVPFLGSKAQAGGAVGSTSLMTTLTGGAANTKGSWVQLIASTDIRSTLLWLIPDSAVVATTATRCNIALDIGIGAASSEIVVISNYLGFSCKVNENGDPCMIPLVIPKGSRVAARIAGTVASETMRLGVIVVGGGPHPFPAGPRCETLGVTLTLGTTVTAGSANTKGSWVSIGSPTTRSWQWILPAFALVDTSANTADYLFDIGVQIGGTDYVLIPDIAIQTTTAEAMSQPRLIFPCSLPPGSQLRARCQSTTGSDANVGVSLVGVEV